MIAQMAQFSALEATQRSTRRCKQAPTCRPSPRPAHLIGKYIQANQADGTSTTGAVTGVDFTTTNGVVSPTLVVNGKDVDYSTIVKVSSSPITND